jgi:M6 family metalloprotease-like protein
MKSKVNSWFPGAAWLLLTAAAQLSGQRLEDFGYGRMTVGGVQARGARPLVIVLQQFSSAPAAGVNGQAPGLAHSSTEFDQLMFNFFQKSANAYFSENSRGRFFWTRAGAGIYGPFFHTGAQFDLEDPANGKRLKRLNLALQDLASAGFNFANYDTNGDKVITSNELTVMVIDNISGISGGNRGPAPNCYAPANQNVNVCLGMITIGDRASLMTFVHELSHQLGTIEMYGSNFNANFQYTLMGATMFPNNDDRRTFHLDPWHKMMLGWLEPRIYSLDSDGSATISASQLPNGTTPVILYSPARGTREFYILEFRSATLPSGAGYDANVNGVGVSAGATGTGLVIWHIKTSGLGGEDVNSDVSVVPFYDGAGVTMISAFMNGSPNFSGGKGGVWAPNALIPYYLKWLDGLGRNVRIKVGALSADQSQLAVSWGEFADPPPPVPNQKLLFYNTSTNWGATGIIDDATATVQTLQNCVPGYNNHWTHIAGGSSDLFFYQDSTGAAAIGKLDAAGNCSLTQTYAAGTFGPGWTHIVYHKGYYFFYNKWNGLGAVGKFENGSFHQYNSWTAFARGWTQIVSTPNGLLFYNAANGSGAVGEWSFVRSNTGFGAIVGVNFTQLKGYGVNSFSTGWTHIVNTNDGVLYYNADTGLNVMGDVNAGGVLGTRSNTVQTLARGWTSIVSDGKNILFYNASNGTGAVAFIRQVSILTAGTSTAGALGIRRELSGFSPGWTNIVAAANDTF